MKQHIIYKRTLFALFLVIVFSSFGQQQITHTATKENISCNYDCTLLDIAELNDNPSALLFLKSSTEPGGKPNPHPVGFYYFKGKWHIINLDQRAVLAGTTFQVEYLTKADPTHFQYEFTKADIQRDGSAWIDHPALNNNPTARFTTSPSWIPEKKAFANRDEAAIRYDSLGGRWSVSNLNKKPMFDRINYNIAIEAAGSKTVSPPIVTDKISLPIGEVVVPANPNPSNPNAISGDIIVMLMAASVGNTKLPGDSKMTAFPDHTELWGFEMSSNNLSARKNIYEPITIRLHSGTAMMIQLLNAYITKQSMTFQIDALTVNANVGKNVVNYTIKLSGASISSYRQVFLEELSQTGGTSKFRKTYDEVKVTFTQIEFTNSSGATATDNF
ncbi:MAG: hypothetical protein ABL876_09655 [Chitinophagaceae bacterium]